MAPDRGTVSLAAGGTSFQAMGGPSARARSRSPLDDIDGEDPLDSTPTDHTPLNPSGIQDNDDDGAHRRRQQDERDPETVRARQAAFLATRAQQPQNFTLRGVVVGTLIGTVICLSNTYFGLQTGWISGMAMPASLLGYAWFKTFSRFLAMPFTPVENVLVQCVAGAVGTMPLGVGLVGVLPALQFLPEADEGGKLNLSLIRLIIWSVGVCFFGVFVAVPLRREVLVREKLKFPSGTATGLMIGLLHGDTEALEQKKLTEEGPDADIPVPEDDDDTRKPFAGDEEAHNDWKRKVRNLVIAFGGSGLYTLVSYFIPQIHGIPIFGTYLAKTWLWKLNPSPAYVGQGIIMGPETTLHILLGALVGWCVLSPVAKEKGWAPGPVDDWEHGSKGWIVWVSLAVMLADSLVNLGWLVMRPLLFHGPAWYAKLRGQYKEGEFGRWTSLFRPGSFRGAYQPLDVSSSQGQCLSPRHKPVASKEQPEADAPPEHLPSQKMTLIGLGVSCVLCVVGTHIAFPGLIPFYATILAVMFSLVLSVMGVRALGETDLNPVSGISKLTQLAFAVILPMTPASIPANLIAGAISESAALQAGDMMQDLKTGHILGASPLAQFYGQLIGSGAGAVIASMVYKLYTSVYTMPSDLFQMPTAYVWIFTARLVEGKGLPPKVGPAATIAGAIWVVLTVIRIRAKGRWWRPLVPGGIAVAVGLYNVPSFTLARVVGGLVSLWWTRRGGTEETLVVLASGLILGEGVGSIVNLLMASGDVPHL